MVKNNTALCYRKKVEFHKFIYTKAVPEPGFSKNK